jgi:hypothetical protein
MLSYGSRLCTMAHGKLLSSQEGLVDMQSCRWMVSRRCGSSTQGYFVN